MEKVVEEQLPEGEQRDLLVREYRSLVDNQGWSRLQARLDRLLKAREREKSKALRANDLSASLLQQGFIDGIIFVMGEPNSIIKLLTPSEED